MYNPNEEVLRDVAEIILSNKMKENENYLEKVPALVSKALRFASDKDVNYRLIINKKGKHHEIDVSGDIKATEDDKPYIQGLSLIISAASLLNAGIKELNIDHDTAIEIMSALMITLDGFLVEDDNQSRT